MQMQYLSCSRRWDYYRHILPLVLTHDTIRYDINNSYLVCNACLMLACNHKINRIINNNHYIILYYIQITDLTENQANQIQYIVSHNLQ